MSVYLQVVSNLCFIEITSNFTSINIVGKRHTINAEISSILPMRKTLDFAQYQVATIGAPVDLFYHIRSSESSTNHRARKVIHGE